MSAFDSEKKSLGELAKLPTRPRVIRMQDRQDTRVFSSYSDGGRRQGLEGIVESVGTERMARAIVKGRLTGPVKLLNIIFDEWGIHGEDSAIVLGYESSDLGFVDDLLHGVVTLSGRDVKDRVAYLITIYNLLNKLFGNDKEVVSKWLHEKQRRLSDKSPFEYVKAGSMEKLLHVKYLVELMAGRY